MSVGTIERKVEKAQKNIRTLYLEDDIPWIVGYSGGKDSTATLQLVWDAISSLEPEQIKKKIYVISTDTMVENPVVALWVNKSLDLMKAKAVEQGLPIEPHKLKPIVEDSFWVNLIGRGYPAPRPKFRWCTERLKIRPANRFISDVIKSKGEAILVLGTRKAESNARAASMEKYENSSRALLSKNGDPSLDRAWIFPPIGEWSNDDVWEYLMNYPNSWGHGNQMLFEMYRGATADKECPLVVDTSTPSCGDSRFGCYVCTLVDQDKSMAAMIQNEEENAWMKPLLEIRNKWLSKDDRKHRDFKRMNGSLSTYSRKVKNDKGEEVEEIKLVPGPYKQEYRASLLRELLECEKKVREASPEEITEYELLSKEEIIEIRRIWVDEKNEIEDLASKIYFEVRGERLIDEDSGFVISDDDLSLLKNICIEHGDPEGVIYKTLRDLLGIESKYKTMTKRVGLFNELEKTIDINAFSTAKDAEIFAVERDQAKKRISEQAK